MRALFLALVCLFAGGFPASQASEASLKVAAVHFKPDLGDVASNRERLLALNEKAAKAGAKIIVNTEMATSGYALFSRAEIAAVAETIPGVTTEAFGQLAKRHAAYIVIGLPEFDTATNQYFNSAVLIGPDGEVAGTYRKRNTLIEASYNAVAGGPIPTVDTPYGRIAVVICADLFYPHFARLAAVSGADILLAPANTGVDLDFLAQRARENDIALIVSNRYGKERQGNEADVFSEDTFAIPSPWPYDFSFGSLSAVVEHDGSVVSHWTDSSDGVVLGEISPSEERVFPILRRPELYSTLNQDTLESYTFSKLGLPEPMVGLLGAMDLGGQADEISELVSAADDAVAKAASEQRKLNLLVLAPGSYASDDEAFLKSVDALAERTRVDLVIPFEGTSADPRPTSMMFTVEGGSVNRHRYVRTHRLRNENIGLGDDFLIVDRPYGRVAILHGADLLAPETTMVMAKLGVDIAAVSADLPPDGLTSLWRTRSNDYLTVVVANRSGDEGIFLGYYPANAPRELVGEGLNLMSSDSGQTRNKKEPRHVDTSPLLLACSASIC
ncbi:MAG TPA: nitrilase-related carbon-nitrogen hydrolase [Pseudaminobacter sp.]|nr:nitrilase-related carbon-nitrogen hydrolase [Pseudaminobacter sp.]